MNAGKVIKTLALVFLVGLFVGGILLFDLYRKAYAPNVQLQDDTKTYLYIKTGASYADVLNQIKEIDILKNIDDFEWVAKRKNYKNHVYAGRYLVKNRMSNNEFVNLLRSGEQEPISITFNNILTVPEFAAVIADQLEFDSSELLQAIYNEQILLKYGFNKYTIPCMFIPNTYELYWNTSAEKFMERMLMEYNNFWTKSRNRKAEKAGLSREEVITLASIVDREVRFDDEKRRVAGLYINRINMGIRLQSDPTLIFAANDYTIQRVLNVHKRIDSPYNTYKHGGLPPGPICFPEISSIDAVLNYEKHKYLYMCAKADFSGYHAFAKTLRGHNNNAKAYQRELNKRRIYK